MTDDTVSLKVGDLELKVIPTADGFAIRTNGVIRYRLTVEGDLTFRIVHPQIAYKVLEPYLDRRISDLKLGWSTSRVINKMSIVYVGQLVQLTEQKLLNQLGFGPARLRETKKALSEVHPSLHLGMDVLGWQPSTHP